MAGSTAGSWDWLNNTLDFLSENDWLTDILGGAVANLTNKKGEIYF
jgi:hypothetical protein